MDYQKGKIYKIESHLGPKIYIGSTTKQYLSQRMEKHRSGYNRWKQEKSSNVTAYKLFEEYGIDNCQIVLLELYPCNSKDELNAKESNFIRTLECVNKVIPDRTMQEYRDDNKEKIKDDNKIYYQKNKIEIIEKVKLYRQENIEKINSHRNQQITCECGCSFQLKNKARHLQSKKHLSTKN